MEENALKVLILKGHFEQGKFLPPFCLPNQPIIIFSLKFNSAKFHKSPQVGDKKSTMNGNAFLHAHMQYLPWLSPTRKLTKIKH